MGASPPSCSTRREQRLGDVVGLDRAAGQVDDRDAQARRPAPAQVVAQAHGAGRVVAHRRHAAVGRARPDGHDGGRLRRQPVDPGAGGDRLAALGVDAEPRPVALAVDLLVGHRALEHEHEGVEAPALGVVPGAHELVAVLEGEHRVVDDDGRRARDRAREQLLERRAGRRRQRDGVAVTAQPARHPHHVDQLALAAPLARGELRLQHQARAGARDRRGGLGRDGVPALGEAREVVVERAVQVPLVAAAGDELGLGEAGERVGDRRALGARRAARAGGG